MADYREFFYDSSDGLKLFARDYAHPDPRATLLCMHGLTRNSADFAHLCNDLAGDFRIISVDQRGRGLSEYDSNAANYSAETYVRDMFTLLDTLELERVIAIGTSMGGVISMAMGATNPQRLAGIVLNDIGPEIDPAGLDRIRSYVGKLPPGRDLGRRRSTGQTELTRSRFRTTATPIGWLSRATSTAKVMTACRSSLTIPAIAESITANNVTPTMWPIFDGLKDIPLLVVRGETSDILAPGCVDQMRERRADLAFVEVPNRGHAPMLDEAPAARRDPPVSRTRQRRRLNKKTQAISSYGNLRHAG